MTKPPNIIWVFGDQHRAQAMSCAGDPNVATPNLDRMAQEGGWFRRAVMGFPLCCPARGSILTGRYPHQCVPGHEHPLPADMPTLAKPLRDAGYHTAWFGKWHLGGLKESQVNTSQAVIPREQRGGFDTWLGYENNNAQFDCHVHGHRDAAEVAGYRLPTFETDALTDLVLDHVRERAEADQPFFTALSAQPPHDPYTAPEQWMQRHNPATLQLRPNVPPYPRVQDQARRELAGYYALIENLDWNLGRVRALLRELDIDRETYVVFFSDHGDHHGSHGHFRKMTPYEEAINVPLIIAGPSYRTHRVRFQSHHRVNHVDLAPTTLGLAGIQPPPEMQGFNYAPMFSREDCPTFKPPGSAYLQCVIPTGHGNSINSPCAAWPPTTAGSTWPTPGRPACSSISTKTRTNSPTSPIIPTPAASNRNFAN